MKSDFIYRFRPKQKVKVAITEVIDGVRHVVFAKLVKTHNEYHDYDGIKYHLDLSKIFLHSKVPWLVFDKGNSEPIVIESSNEFNAHLSDAVDMVHRRNFLRLTMSSLGDKTSIDWTQVILVVVVVAAGGFLGYILGNPSILHSTTTTSTNPP